MEPENTATPSAALEKRMQRLHTKKDLRTLIIFLVVTALVVYLLLGVFFGGSVVIGNSMNTELEDGDLVFYYRLAKDYKVGDILIFKHGDTELVKRVAATAGDVVNIDAASGLLTVNGEQQANTLALDNSVAFPITVRAGTVFVLGDNRGDSTDSRSATIGLVEEENIVGRVALDLRLFRN